MANKSIRFREYFGAANSYRGFISDFDKIFSSDTIDKLFIIKGGPGTGKSSLLRKAGKKAEEVGAEVDFIYCSSDTESLDGIICRMGEKAIAAIDGTAPHITDPKNPGVTDEIINIADGFNKSALYDSKEKIIALSKEKSEAYRRCYCLLGAAGQIAEYITSQIESLGVYYEAVNELLEQIGFSKFEPSLYTGTIKRRISSFGKNGYFLLSTPQSEKTKICLKGDNLSCFTITRSLYQRLSGCGVLTAACPSVLNPDCYDAIYTDDAIIQTQISTSDSSTEFTAPFIPSSLRGLNEKHDELLTMAQDELKRASLFHFALEDIYKRCVDFTFNDKLYSYISNEIDRILL